MRCLDNYGFKYVDYVYEPGQYAQRGSILICSRTHQNFLIVSTSGDEVESIRNFDMESQLSIEKFNNIRIVLSYLKLVQETHLFFISSKQFYIRDRGYAMDFKSCSVFK